MKTAYISQELWVQVQPHVPWYCHKSRGCWCLQDPEARHYAATLHLFEVGHRLVGLDLGRFQLGIVKHCALGDPFHHGHSNKEQRKRNFKILQGLSLWMATNSFLFRMQAHEIDSGSINNALLTLIAFHNTECLLRTLPIQL